LGELQDGGTPIVVSGAAAAAAVWWREGLATLASGTDNFTAER